MKLSRQTFASIVLCVSVSACQDASMRGSAPHVTQANLSMSSILSALPRISAASSDRQATELFVDPGTEFSMDAVTTLGDNPDRRSCEGALKQLTHDQSQLRRTNAWQTMITSPVYLAVTSGIQQVRHDGCHTAISASTLCQKEFEVLNATIDALWKSPEYQALEQTSEYAVLQDDASALSHVGNSSRHCGDVHGGARGVERASTAHASSVMATYDTARPAWQWQTKTAQLTSASIHRQHSQVARVMESRHHARRHRHDHNRGYGTKS